MKRNLLQNTSQSYYELWFVCERGSDISYYYLVSGSLISETTITLYGFSRRIKGNDLKWEFFERPPEQKINKELLDNCYIHRIETYFTIEKFIADYFVELI